MKPKATDYYAKKIIKYIPKEAYKPATYKLVPMYFHSLIIFGSIAFLSYNDSIYSIIGFSILSGISIACIFLYSHELSHGTIVRKQPYLYILQNFFWAFSGIPPTVWKKIHNLSHHKHMNTYKDPDRKTFKSEDSFFNRLYNLFIYPNRVLRYSTTVGAAMMFYSVKHTLAVFYTTGNKPSIVTYKPTYTSKEKNIIALEIIYILFFWISIWLILGGWNGIIYSLISWYTYSALVILFIITQHQRDQVFKNIADPLLTSTSVIIPKWLDRILDWHSFHVEHHVLPGINFDYYPLVSQELQKHFPERYQRMPLFKAVKEAYSEDVLIDDPLL